MPKKKVVKPTKAEELEINRRLEKKYPGRKYKIKKKGLARIKQKLKAAFSPYNIHAKDTVQLSRNLSKDQIKRLRGK